MAQRVIVDAGPVVAFLLERDEHHAWARAQFERFPHFHTCEAVVAEVCARLACYDLPQSLTVELIREDILRLDFSLRAAADRVHALMEKYRNVPMDLADGCVVAMSEQERNSLIVTTDADDFKVYRRNGRDVIPMLTP